MQKALIYENLIYLCKTNKLKVINLMFNFNVLPTKILIHN